MRPMKQPLHCCREQRGRRPQTPNVTTLTTQTTTKQTTTRELQGIECPYTPTAEPPGHVWGVDTLVCLGVQQVWYHTMDDHTMDDHTMDDHTLDRGTPLRAHPKLGMPPHRGRPHHRERPLSGSRLEKKPKW